LRAISTPAISAITPAMPPSTARIGVAEPAGSCCSTVAAAGASFSDGCDRSGAARCTASACSLLRRLLQLKPVWQRVHGVVISGHFASVCSRRPPAPPVPGHLAWSASLETCADLANVVVTNPAAFDEGFVVHVLQVFSQKPGPFLKPEPHVTEQAPIGSFLHTCEQQV